MRVLLVSNYVLDRQYSMLGFADCLERHLPRSGIEVVRCAPPPRLGILPMPKKAVKWFAYFDKYILFTRQLKRAADGMDVVHVLDHGNAMYVPIIRTKPHIVTCHDLLAARASLGEIPGWIVGPTGRKYQDMILRGLAAAQFIVTVSETTRRDLVRLFPDAANRTETILNGLYRELSPENADRALAELAALGIKRPYLLHVGNDSHYKNRGGAVRIWRRMQASGMPNLNLVLAGKMTSPGDGESISSGVGRLIHVPSPSDQTLANLYSQAEGLLFPSLYEGFGLPILEAQSLGCPVFTSDRPPMNEIAGSGAALFDPENIESAAQRVMEGLGQRKTLIAAGHENCRRFSTDEMIASYTRVYQKVYNG